MSELPIYARSKVHRPIKQAIRRRRALALFGAVGLVAAAQGCGPRAGNPNEQANAAHTAVYKPRTRELTVTTVPLLVKEQQRLFPFLAADFANGGVLDGKEVYAFSPATLTVVEGDTLNLTLINPEDDVHSFVLPDFSVALPPQKTTRATYVARHAGIFPIVCAIQSHLPMMSGQLVVLTQASMAGSVEP